MAGFFITGTDTGVGKTFATVALMRWLKSSNRTVLGFKPVATGCFVEDGQLRNDDALQLQANASFHLDYKLVNPYAFEVATSPHIAARLANVEIDIKAIAEHIHEFEHQVDYVLVEGIGGFEVPLTDCRKVSDLTRELELPVIVVVGMRLGCLNHALLTYSALSQVGVECAGWIANQIDAKFAYLQECIDTLEIELPCPYLGLLSYGSDGHFIGGTFSMEADDKVLQRQCA